MYNSSFFKKKTYTNIRDNFILIKVFLKALRDNLKELT